MQSIPVWQLLLGTGVLFGLGLPLSQLGARDLGFSMKEIAALVGLWRNRGRVSGDVKRLAARHMRQLDEKICELQAMRDALAHLSAHCHGDDRPDCPILEDLAAGPNAHCAERTAGSGRRKSVQPTT